MAQTNKTENALLGLLTLEPMSGYDMKAFIVRSIGFFWQESYGQIYPALKRLLKNQYVTRKVSGKKGRPDRHVYSITAKGRKRLATWLESETEPERVRHELLLKLFFGPETTPAIYEKQIQALLQRQAARLKAFERVEEGILQEYKSSPHYPYWYSTLRFGVHVTKARAAWCRETLSMLKTIDKK